MTDSHTIGDLRQMQSLPLQAKIRMTRRRIKDWVDRYGENGVYVSFSGGKDSTVLLDIVRKDYPDIKAVFVNTGLEYPSVRAFAESKENVTTLQPETNFRDVIIRYGYPMISKEVSNVVYEARNLKDDKTKTTRMLRLNGELLDKNGNKSQFNCEAYQFLLNAPFQISDKCCNAMKKRPFYDHEKKTGAKAILATMAEESRLRLQKWLKSGCNAFESRKQLSRPMSFWTENDVLEYIHENDLPIAAAYGQVVVKSNGIAIDGQINIHDYLRDYRDCQYETTGCRRTGCIFCGFGITQDKQRFVRLSEQEPILCDYVMCGGEFFYRVFDRNGTEIHLKHCTHKQIEKWCADNEDNRNFKIESMWQPSKDGLGYWFVLEWLNAHGGLEIGIPDREHYRSEFQTEETRKYLEREIVEKEEM